MNEDIFHLGVKALIRNEEGKMLLLKTNPDDLKGYDGEPYWDIPGGRIERGSTVEDTLRRELEEETGISVINSFKPIGMTLSNVRIPIADSDVGLILSVNLCDVGEVEKITISKEHLGYDWFEPSEAARLLAFKYPAEFTQKIAEIK